MKSIKIAILSVLIAVYVVSIPIYTFAMDMVYINNPEIWYSDSRVITMPEQNLGNYSGIYGYCIDTENTCFYLHISYSEKNLRDNENDIKVEFQISNSINNYSFIVDENGIIPADSEIKKSFNTACNFSEATRQGQEIHLGIEFKNKTDKTVDNNISFSVVVNGKAYNLTNSIKLPFYKEETTKEKVNDKTTAVKETKKNSRTTDKSSTSKATTEKTTKFKYVAPVTQNSDENYSYDNEYENEEILSEDTVVLTEEDVSNRSTLSTSSKILIAVSIIAIAAGITIAIYYSNKAKKAKMNETEE